MTVKKISGVIHHSVKKWQNFLILWMMTGSLLIFPLAVNAIDLNGEWLGEGYRCGLGGAIQERVQIIHQGNSVEATKITGDNCVLAGTRTFSGTLDGKGDKIQATWVTGTPNKPACCQKRGRITIVDDNTLKSNIGVTYRRVSQNEPTQPQPQTDDNKQPQPQTEADGDRERYTDNGDNTVTDHTTGLIWLENANCIGSEYPDFDKDCPVGDGKISWAHAQDFINALNAGQFPKCNGGSYNDWRLPTVQELESLVNYDLHHPAMSPDVFSNVISDNYWTATLDASNHNFAWRVRFDHGLVFTEEKSHPFYVWPVRGQQCSKD